MLNLNCTVTDNGYLIVRGCYLFRFLQPIGIPLLYFLVLKNYKNKISPSQPGITEDQMMAIRKNDDSLSHIRSLFDNFRPTAMYFEVFDAVRRIVLSATICFMGTSSMCAAFGCSIAFVCLDVQRRINPYLTSELNALAYWANFTLMSTFFMSLLIISRPFAYNGFVIGSILIIQNTSLFVMSVGIITGVWGKLGLYKKSTTVVIHPVNNNMSEECPPT